MIELININKSFKNKKNVLKNINLVLPKKGLVILRGESGSGKSTLLNILTGSDNASEGEIFYNNQEIDKKYIEDFRRNYVSIIYQDFRLIDNLSVIENVSLALQASGINCEEKDLISLLKAVDIERYANTKTKDLSGGEKQRCAIARGLISKDTMIFADEPTGNLDSINSTAVMELLKKTAESKLVVVVSHNDELNEKFGDYFITLEDGEIVENTINNIKNEDSFFINAEVCDNKNNMNKRTSSDKQIASKIENINSSNRCYINKSEAVANNAEIVVKNDAVDNNTETVNKNEAIANNAENVSCVESCKTENNDKIENNGAINIGTPKNNANTKTQKQKSFNHNKTDKKPKFKFSTFTKLASWSFSRNKGKQILSFLAVVVLASLTAFFIPLSILDIEMSAVMTAKNAKSSSVMINVDYNGKEREYNIEEIIKKSKLNISSAISVPSYIKVGSNDVFLELNSYEKMYNQTSYIIESNSINDVDVKIIEGHFPDNIGEVIIPLQFANTLMKTGTRVFKNGNWLYDNIGISSFADLVGKKIYFGMDNEFSLSIAGVFDDAVIIDEEIKNIKGSSQLTEKQKKKFSVQLNNNYLAKSCIGKKGVGDIIKANFRVNQSISKINTVSHINDKNYNSYNIGGYIKGFNEYENSVSPAENEVCISENLANNYGITQVGQKLLIATSEINYDNSNINSELNEPKNKGKYEFVVKEIYNSNIVNLDIIFNYNDLNRIVYENSNQYNNINLRLDGKNTYFKLRKLYKELEKNSYSSQELDNKTNSFSIINQNKLSEFFSNAYKYKYIIIMPITIAFIITLIFFFQLTMSYALSAKQNTFVILRTLGFKQRNISSIILSQFLLSGLVQIVLSLLLGKVFCRLFSLAFTKNITNEVLLTSGWQSPVIISGLLLILPIVFSIMKCSDMFKQSLTQLNSKKHKM